MKKSIFIFPIFAMFNLYVTSQDLTLSTLPSDIFDHIIHDIPHRSDLDERIHDLAPPIHSLSLTCKSINTHMSDEKREKYLRLTDEEIKNGIHEWSSALSVGTLVHFGADINKPIMDDGGTLLHFAALGCRDDTFLKFLLSHPKINRHKIDENGNTPFDYTLTSATRPFTYRDRYFGMSQFFSFRHMKNISRVGVFLSSLIKEKLW